MHAAVRVGQQVLVEHNRRATFPLGNLVAETYYNLPVSLITYGYLLEHSKREQQDKNRIELRYPVIGWPSVTKMLV